MSIFGAPIFGGFGFGFGGPFGIQLDERVKTPPDPDAKAEPDEALERPNPWLGFAARAGLPGFTKAPTGCDAVYWQMRKYSACVLAFAVTASPIFAGTRTLEICDDGGTPANKRPGGPLAGDGPTESPEDKIKAVQTRHFDPLWPDILNGLERLNFGRWNQEVRWDRKDGLTLPVAFKDFKPGEAGILYDAYGDFAGLRYNNQDLLPQYVLHHVHQPHLDRLNGYPRLENCRADWWYNHETEDRLGRAERKASGISLLISFDRDYKFKDSTGATVNTGTVAQTMVDALSTGGTAVVPRYSFDRKTLEKDPKLAEIKPVEAEAFDWGQTAHAILACISVLDARDKRIMRAYGRPEREAMEGQHGTKAEAGTQGQIGTLDSEKVHAEIVRDFNRQTWRTVLLTNYGEQYLDRLYWKPTPLADDSKQFLQKAILAMLAAPGDPLPAMVDRKAMLQKGELPYDESYVPPPALPTQPTPPEGGPGDQQQPAGGNGQANGTQPGKGRMALSAYGEDGPDPESPFDDGYALALNCGTGAGGFQPNNVCSKGGRQFVVSKVTRKGMLHGRGVDESPDVPPVELGHVSEFTAAETPLSAAPLPEFAAKVKALADAQPQGFGGNKVLVSHVYEAAHAADPSLIDGEFKAKLRQARTAGLIEMSRIDLTSRFHPADITASTVNLTPGKAANAPEGVGDTTVEMIVVPERARREVRGAT